MTTALGWERLRPEPFALAGHLLHFAGDSPLGARLLERAIALKPGLKTAENLARQMRAGPRAWFQHPKLTAWFKALPGRLSGSSPNDSPP